MNIKINYFFNYLDKFPTNLGDVGEEQGEDFTKTLNQRKKGAKVDGAVT